MLCCENCQDVFHQLMYSYENFGLGGRHIWGWGSLIYKSLKVEFVCEDS